MKRLFGLGKKKENKQRSEGTEKHGAASGSKDTLLLEGVDAGSAIDIESVIAGAKRNNNKNNRDLPSFLHALSTRGWAFVRLPFDISEDAQRSAQITRESFLADDGDELGNIDGYNVAHAPPVFGFTERSDRRWSVRMITGKHIDRDWPRVFDRCDSQSRLDTFQRRFAKLARSLDALQVQLIEALRSEGVLDGISISGSSNHADTADEPVDVSLANGAENGFGLIDLVGYPPADEGVEIVSAHTDPGLLAISVCSTQSGLQLLDPSSSPSSPSSSSSDSSSGRWVNGPVNTGVRMGKIIGVVWLGNAAVAGSNGRFRAGVHRVIGGGHSQQKDRVTVWHESCVVDQVPQGAAMGGIAAILPPRKPRNSSTTKRRERTDIKNSTVRDMPVGLLGSKININMMSNNNNNSNTNLGGILSPFGGSGMSSSISRDSQGRYVLADPPDDPRTFDVVLRGASGPDVTAVVSPDTSVSRVAGLIDDVFGIPMTKTMPSLHCDGKRIRSWNFPGDGVDMSEAGAVKGSVFSY